MRNRHSPALHARADCEPADPLNTLTDRLNTLLNSSGAGYVLPLCPGVQYHIQAPILFNAQDQEISTVGYPTDDSRATLVVSGPVANGQGHTTAVDGTCQNCSGVKLRNIQVRRGEIFSPRAHPSDFYVFSARPRNRSMARAQGRRQRTAARTSKWAARTRTS